MGGGEGHRQVHHPWLVHVEAQEQAGDEGWQEGGLREGGHGKGEASIQSCEGLLCGSVEKEHLSRQPAQVLEWTFHSKVFRAPGSQRAPCTSLAAQRQDKK